MQTSKDYLHVFLDMGDALLNSGAEIFRVEDTLNRMGYACGATHMNVFVITSSIVITMEFPGDGARTQTRRIHECGGNDFTKLEQLNDLSRRLSKTSMYERGYFPICSVFSHRLRHLRIYFALSFPSHG